MADKIDPSNLVGLTEIGEMAGVSCQVVYNWRWRYENFPEPVVILKCGPIFSAAEVKLWLRIKGRI